MSSEFEMLKMDIVHLRTFLTVADCGSITYAASRLACVQSNVTSRIHQLESELQTRLFVRSRQGVALTVQGEQLYPKARTIVDLMQKLKPGAQSKAVAGTLRLGAVETAAAFRVPALMGRLSRDYPDLAIELKTGTSHDIVRAVKALKLDVAIVSGAIADPALAATVLDEDELVIVQAAHANEPQISRKNPPRALYVYRQGCAFRAALEAWLYSLKAAPRTISEIGSLDGILAHVASGKGVTALPRKMVEMHSLKRELRCLPLPGKYRRIVTCAVHLPDTAGDPRLRLSSRRHVKNLPALRWKMRNLDELQKSNPERLRQQADELQRKLGL